MAIEKRLVVSGLFACRIITPAFAIASLVSMENYYRSSPPDRPWYAVTPAIWTQIMINTSVVTACIPSLKPILTDFGSGLTGVTISGPFELTHSGRKQGTGTANVKSTSSSGSGLA
ncbi:hypothetical protein AJ79_10033 [Helicocarpus griseus UAMH5409]|uniref:Rhodopsin domain-containing protein n=1 Tax=Helicocarpus griseus UAMH5409 TaxID=1447875 RepID=A0A2B7WG34_9EURO|nr:hypothetical protein AJ79_10033 [Helicocarpus griseus UAMH5409]